MKIVHTLLTIFVIRWVRCGDSCGKGTLKGTEQHNPPKSTTSFSFDVANPDEVNTELTCEMYPGIKLRRYVPRDGHDIGSVVDNSFEIWKVGERDICSAVNLYYKDDKRFVVLWILNEGLTNLYFEKAGEKWNKIDLAKFTGKLNGVDYRDNGSEATLSVPTPESVSSYHTNEAHKDRLRSHNHSEEPSKSVPAETVSYTAGQEKKRADKPKDTPKSLQQAQTSQKGPVQANAQPTAQDNAHQGEGTPLGASGEGQGSDTTDQSNSLPGGDVSSDNGTQGTGGGTPKSIVQPPSQDAQPRGPPQKLTNPVTLDLAKPDEQQITYPVRTGLLYVRY